MRTPDYSHAISINPILLVSRANNHRRRTASKPILGTFVKWVPTHISGNLIQQFLSSIMDEVPEMIYKVPFATTNHKPLHWMHVTFSFGTGLSCVLETKATKCLCCVLAGLLILLGEIFGPPPAKTHAGRGHLIYARTGLAPFDKQRVIEAI